MNVIRFLSAAALLLVAPAVGAQSLLERTPNVSGDWVGAPGTLYFHFAHRFTTSDAPERKVSNVPTFLLAAGLPKRLLAGFNYSTNSTLAPRFPNEWELFARWAPLSEDLGAPLDIGGQVGYNNAANGIDGELSLAKKLGITRVIVAGRGLSDPLRKGNARFAVAGGATIRLGQYVALAGDVGSLVDRDSTERVAWSAGIHFAIPLTPHTVSLHASNAAISTLQGASRGTNTVRYGFEFTIPLTLRRYFGKRAESGADTATASVETATDSATVGDRLAVTPAPVTVQPSTAGPPAAAPSAPSAPPRTSVPPPDTMRRRTTAPAEKPKTTTAPKTATPKTTAPSAPARASTPKPAPAARTVRSGMKNINYLQPRLQVTVGTTVEWKNNDPLPHTVTATDKNFNSGLIQPGKTYSHTFTKAGTYNYYCMPHPFMKGVVVVKEP